MSRKTTPRETEKPKKLTRAQKKEIDAVIRKYKGDGKPRTADVYKRQPQRHGSWKLTSWPLESRRTRLP